MFDRATITLGIGPHSSFALEKQPANNMRERLVNKNTGTVPPSYATVTGWVAEFKLGRASLEDEPRDGRPVEATTDDCCRAMETMAMGDR